MMKKYTCLLLFALFLNGCDDGDLTVEEFDFDDVTTISSCTGSEINEVIYKLKDQESLVLQIPKTILKNEVIGNGVQEITIDNTTNKLSYRAYDGPVTSANICDAIRPVNPNVTNEWNATGGTFVITTRASTSPLTADNSTRITGYSHLIELKNVSYSKPGVQIGPSFVFGTFTTPLKNTETLNLVFDESALQCPSSKQVYNVNGSESFTIDNLDPELITNTPTAPGDPRIQDITATGTNKVTFKVYSNGTITDNYFCVTPTPATPTVRETWIAESGKIQVETSTLGNSFKHIITFRDVKLVKGGVSFMLGNNFKSWELITTP